MAAEVGRWSRRSTSFVVKNGAVLDCDKDRGVCCFGKYKGHRDALPVCCESSAKKLLPC